jgi:hypothetical protein
VKTKIGQFAFFCQNSYPQNVNFFYKKLITIHLTKETSFPQCGKLVVENNNICKQLGDIIFFLDG